jgi:hypothetical protein
MTRFARHVTVVRDIFASRIGLRNVSDKAPKGSKMRTRRQPMRRGLGRLSSSQKTIANGPRILALIDAREPFPDPVLHGRCRCRGTPRSAWALECDVVVCFVRWNCCFPGGKRLPSGCEPQSSRTFWRTASSGRERVTNVSKSVVSSWVIARAIVPRHISSIREEGFGALGAPDGGEARGPPCSIGRIQPLIGLVSFGGLSIVTPRHPMRTS